MPQLGRLDYTAQDTAGNAASGASVTVYREGATVNGNQSGVSPLTVTVRHPGKIVATDTVFVNAVSGTTYTVGTVTSTTMVLSGYVGTLSLTNGDRLVPSNSQPTLYSDDRGGATTANPLTTSSNGNAQCYIAFGAYDLLLSGGGLTTRLVQSQVMPTETPAYGRIFYAESYGLTVAGVQAAIDECESVGGGWVIVPQAAGIVVTDTSVKIGKGVTLKSTGERVITQSYSSTFTANASTNVSAMIENKTQDGTQQFVGIDGIFVNGNKSSGAVVTAGVKLVGVFINSRLRDSLVIDCSGNGVLMQTATNGLGGIDVHGLTVSGCNSDNIVVKSTVNDANDIRLDKIESDNPAAGKAALLIDNSVGGASGFKSQCHVITDFYCELDQATAIAILLDSCQAVSINGINHNTPSGTTVQIKNTGGNSTDCSDIVIQNLRSRGTTLIDDVAHSVSISNSTSAYVTYYSTPTSGTNSGGAVIGLQYQKSAGSVASAASLNLNKEGNLFTITGTTNVTGIAPTISRENGRVVYLLFSGILTFTHGNNIFLAGAANFVTAANSLLTLICDGTNWYEVARKA